MIGNIICPECGHKQPIVIPIGKCQAFYLCNKCKKTIQAKNKCCVFCDYGDRTCPVGH